MSFFFQAEDGIRATSVTGVQTCALPIYELRRTDELEERAASDDCRARQQRGLVTGERCGCHHSLRSLCAAGFTALRLFLFFKHLAGQREEDLIELRLTQGHVVQDDVQGFQVLQRVSKQLEATFNA